MRVAIVDDELHCVESLALHIQDLFPEMKIVYKTCKVQEAAESLPNLGIDLLFLDIEMPGMNGFELLAAMPDRDFDVIFTTAYSQYALQAFKANAIHYLLKPIDEEELKEAIRFTEQEDRLILQGNGKKLEEVLDHLKSEGFMKNRISVSVADGYEFLETDQIMYCKSQSNYTTLFLADSSRVMVSKTIKEVEKVLDRFHFIRVHQSFLINPNFMRKLYRIDGGHLEMKDGASVPVSKAKRSLIINLFDMIQKGDF